MLTDFRNWLESELKLLGNASHHAYSFGQANMAKRAIERLDQEFSGRILVAFTREEAAAVLTGLEMLAEQASALAPEFELLRERLTVGFSSAGGADRNLYHE
jgi:predicted component of type VI protein secretion system